MTEHERVAEPLVQHIEGARAGIGGPRLHEEVAERVVEELVVGIQTRPRNQAPNLLVRVEEEVDHDAVDELLHDERGREDGGQCGELLALHRRGKERLVRRRVPDDRAEGADDGVVHVRRLLAIVAHDHQRVALLRIDLDAQSRYVREKRIVRRVGRHQLREDRIH